MSFIYEDEEYKNEHKSKLFFTEEENNNCDLHEQELEEQEEYADIEIEYISNILKSLKEYSYKQGLPLCEHLNFELLSEFMDTDN